jgi:hypothetical protein
LPSCGLLLTTDTTSGALTWLAPPSELYTLPCGHSSHRLYSCLWSRILVKFVQRQHFRTPAPRCSRKVSSATWVEFSDRYSCACTRTPASSIGCCSGNAKSTVSCLEKRGTDSQQLMGASPYISEAYPHFVLVCRSWETRQCPSRGQRCYQREESCCDQNGSIVSYTPKTSCTRLELTPYTVFTLRASLFSILHIPHSSFNISAPMPTSSTAGSYLRRGPNSSRRFTAEWPRLTLHLLIKGILSLVVLLSGACAARLCKLTLLSRSCTTCYTRQATCLCHKATMRSLSPPHTRSVVIFYQTKFILSMLQVFR